MKWNTYQGWQDEGFYVIKGERSILREPDGVPLFHEEQVKEDDNELWCQGHDYWYND